MALVNAVVTDKAREVWPKMLGGLIPIQLVSFFRIGEGGWQTPGPVRRDPDRTFTDLDLILDPGRGVPRYNTGTSYSYFQKSLLPGDIVFEGPTTLKVRCFLDFGDYNAKSSGTVVYNYGSLSANPQMWELAVYDAASNMLAYGTFPQQTKDGTKQIQNDVRIVF